MVGRVPGRVTGMHGSDHAGNLGDEHRHFGPVYQVRTAANERSRGRHQSNAYR